MSAPKNPPTSVVHQGIPDIMVAKPARTCTCRLSNVLGMSLLHSTAPVVCIPAQPARVRITGDATPSFFSPSVNVSIQRLGHRAPQYSAAPRRLGPTLEEAREFKS